MKIAAISITRNDYVRFHLWYEYYQLYKDEICLHIIVDNGSENEYLTDLKRTFTDSIIIQLGHNGGCTEAYNAGIRYALNDLTIDAIMLIGNDVKIEKGGTTKLYNLLMSDPLIGMVGPILLKKDSYIVENFGTNINIHSGKSTQLYRNYDIKDLENFVDETIVVSCVPGGMNLSRASFYTDDVVGLQDENLFMYCDERDMSLRCYAKGLKEVATRSVISWHQHISESKGQREPWTSYLSGRNFVYLAKKHFNKRVLIIDTIQRLFIQTLLVLRNFKSANQRAHYLQYIKGVVAGFRGNMSNKSFNS